MHILVCYSKRAGSSEPLWLCPKCVLGKQDRSSPKWSLSPCEDFNTMFPEEALWGLPWFYHDLVTSTMESGLFSPSSGTQFARNRKPTEKQNSGLSGLYAVNCGGMSLGKTCSFPVFPAGASLPIVKPDKPPVELEADRNSAVKSLELSSD